MIKSSEGMTFTQPARQEDLHHPYTQVRRRFLLMTLPFGRTQKLLKKNLDLEFGGVTFSDNKQLIVSSLLRQKKLSAVLASLITAKLP